MTFVLPLSTPRGGCWGKTACGVCMTNTSQQHNRAGDKSVEVGAAIT